MMEQNKIRLNPLLLFISIAAIAAEITPSIAENGDLEGASVPAKPNRKQFASVFSNGNNKGSVSGRRDDDFDFKQVASFGEEQPSSADTKTLLDEADLRGDESHAARASRARPVIRFGEQLASTAHQSLDSKFKPHNIKGGFLSGKKFLKDTMKNAYKSTKKYVKEASDSLTFIKSKARLTLAIDEAKEDIRSVRKEYGLFTVTWSPIMESALNYVGAKNLDKLKWSTEPDELNFSRDALHVLAIGYEFMRLLNAWRESLLPVHEAYKHYLSTMRQNLIDQQQQQPDQQQLVVDDNLFVQLKAIHNHMLLTGWLTYDALSKEPVEKLEYLINKLEQEFAERDFERSYLRQAMSLGKVFEKTRQKFESERSHVIESLAASGAQSDSYADIDEFLEKFLEAQERGKLVGSVDDCRVPEKMDEFLRSLEPELERNHLVYDKQFLFRLNKGL